VLLSWLKQLQVAQRTNLCSLDSLSFTVEMTRNSTGIWLCLTTVLLHLMPSKLWQVDYCNIACNWSLHEKAVAEVYIDHLNNYFGLLLSQQLLSSFFSWTLYFDLWWTNVPNVCQSWFRKLFSGHTNTQICTHWTHCSVLTTEIVGKFLLIIISYWYYSWHS